MTRGEMFFAILLILGVVSLIALDQLGYLGESESDTPSGETARTEPLDRRGASGSTTGTEGTGAEETTPDSETRTEESLRDPFRDESTDLWEARKEVALAERRIELLKKKKEEERLKKELEALARRKAMEEESETTPDVRSPFESFAIAALNLRATVLKEDSKKAILLLRSPEGEQVTRVVRPQDRLSEDLLVHSIEEEGLLLETQAGTTRVPLNRWITLDGRPTVAEAEAPSSDESRENRQ